MKAAGAVAFEQPGHFSRKSRVLEQQQRPVVRMLEAHTFHANVDAA